jgi:hypothetical protein
MHFALPDIVNGGFEFFGGAFNWLNVRRLMIDKKLRGVSKLPTIIFTTWGVWNIWYYPHLGQWMSFWGGTVIVGANMFWCYLAWKYRHA